MKKKLTIEDAKGWKYLRDWEIRPNLNPKCELCLRASLYDRSMMDDEWRRVCPECFDGKSIPHPSYPSPEMEKRVKSFSPDGNPIPFAEHPNYSIDFATFPHPLPRISSDGHLITKDKKARKEIKELRAEVERLSKLLRSLGRTTITSRPLLFLEKDELCNFLLNKNKD